MGCCLVVIIGAIWPRIALVCVYLFARDIPDRAFHTMLWPVLGFFLMPTTTLAYEIAVTKIGPMDNIWSLLLVILAVLHDFGQFGAFRKRRRD